MREYVYTIETKYRLNFIFGNQTNCSPDKPKLDCN